MNKYTKDDLRSTQNLPLDVKISLSLSRIRSWYNHYNGQVYVSFSGGKDSTVLKHLVETIYDDVPSVFVNTGLEFPELRAFAMSQPNVITVYPEMRFDEVIRKYGYPVISKQSARFIRDLQNPTDRNVATRNLRLTGMNRKGEYCPTQKLAKKWVYLKDAPFKISEQCCDVMKKNPFFKYGKETGRLPYVGTMACESELREKEWLKSGCNTFDNKKPQSKPLSFWTEQDILKYIVNFNLPYASVYGEIKQNETGDWITTGEQRTGCMFCMFGCHLEKEPNRFQRMKITHPKQYDYCMNELGLNEVLNYIGVKYE